MSDRTGGSCGVGLFLAAAALVFGYVWGANARMDAVWNEGYEAGLRLVAEVCGPRSATEVIRYSTEDLW